MPVDLYETLRLQVLTGIGRRTELQLFFFHGMIEGLRLLDTHRSQSAPQAARQRGSLPPTDSAVVRQLANMILVVHAESAHAY